MQRVDTLSGLISGHDLKIDGIKTSIQTLLSTIQAIQSDINYQQYTTASEQAIINSNNAALTNAAANLSIIVNNA